MRDCAGEATGSAGGCGDSVSTTSGYSGSKIGKDGRVLGQRLAQFDANNYRNLDGNAH